MHILLFKKKSHFSPPHSKGFFPQALGFFFPVLHSIDESCGRDSEILNSLSDVCFSGIPDVSRPLDKKLCYSGVTLEEDVRLGNKCCVVRFFELTVDFNIVCVDE